MPLNSFHEHFNNLISISLSISKEMITGFVLLLPKNAYLRPFGNSFSTNPSGVFFFSSKINSSFTSRASIVSISSRVDDRSSQSNSVVESDFVKHCSSGLLFLKSYRKSSYKGIKVSILMQLAFTSLGNSIILYKLNFTWSLPTLSVNSP